MSFMSVFRVLVFIVVSVLAAIVLVIGGYLINLDDGFDFPLFTPMATTIGVLTLFILPACLIVDMIHQGAWTSTIIFESVVLTLLWVVWVTTASFFAEILQGGSGCHVQPYYDYRVTAMECSLDTAIEALSFTICILIFVYVFVLLVFTFIAASRGHKVWTCSVRNTNFLAPSVAQQQFPTAQFFPNPNFGLEQQPFVQAPIPVQLMYSSYQPGMSIQMPGTLPQQHPPLGVLLIVPQSMETPVSP